MILQHRPRKLGDAPPPPAWPFPYRFSGNMVPTVFSLSLVWDENLNVL